MSSTNDLLKKIQALREQHRHDLDGEISRLEANAWEEGHEAARVKTLDEVATKLEQQGVDPAIIAGLRSQVSGAPLSDMPLTVKEYTKHALKTENIDFAGIRDRLSTAGAGHMVRVLLRSQIQVGMLMEVVKKHIFYGKPLGRFNMSMWPLPQADSQLRDEQTLEQRVRAPEVGDRRILRLLHAVAGIVSEAGEIVEPVFKAVFGGKELDVSNLAEEVGDNQWYIAVLADVLRAYGGPDMEQAMQGNVAKLKARYKGTGFSKDAAVTRDLDAENKAREDA